MTITAKPKTLSVPGVDALIKKGGSVPEQHGSEHKVILRIPRDMIAQLDAAIRARPVRKPRHQWILEAVAEKLGREGSPPTAM